MIIVRIKARKPIFDFRKKYIYKYFSDFFKKFKVPLLGNGGVRCGEGSEEWCGFRCGDVVVVGVVEKVVVKN